MQKVWENESEYLDILKMIAPGTIFSEGVENILKAKTGALLVIGDSEEVMKVVDGGFFINQEYSPANLYELAKMDGAIVISKDLKKILYANAQLIPDSTIKTVETGTRHRTAERVAKQTNEIVISVSQRRNVITIFKGNNRYIVNDISIVLNRANQALHTLEKYKSNFDNVLNSLNEFEFEDIVSLENVVNAIQRAEMVMTIVVEVEKSILELGDEGRLIQMQLYELIDGIEDEEISIIKDYALVKNTNNVLKHIRSLQYTSLKDSSEICKMLGFTNNAHNISDINISPRGFRILNKIPRMPASIINKIIEHFENLQSIMNATIDELDKVEGIGEVRAKSIKQNLRKMQEQFLFN